MKIGVLVASERALPSAFTVFRGVAEGVRRAAELGYDGIELAVRGGSEFRPAYIREMFSAYGLEAAAVSTGQVFADQKLWLSARDEKVRLAAVDEFFGIIELAAELGCLVNIGRARGYREDDEPEAETTARFTLSLERVAARARDCGVKLVLEPVNRYETNYINSTDEGAALLEHLKKSDIAGLGLMPDSFHMNIEDASMEGSLRRHINHIGYVHLADSNRLAPGRGHINFASLLRTLADCGYDGWVSIEVLPLPTAEEAARQAITYLMGIYPDWRNR